MRAHRWTLFSWSLQRLLTEWHIICCCKNFVILVSPVCFEWEQNVFIEGINSTWRAIPSGVPQGSLLGPLFFVIFLSDLPEEVMRGNCVSLYADDYKTSRIINWSADHIRRISVRAQLFERWLALTRGLILTQVSFSFYQKHTIG